jgi:copper resistance protein D
MGLLRELLVVGSLLVLLIFFLDSPACPQQHEMPDMPAMNHSGLQGAAATEDPTAAARHMADKRESEFNHHLAGFFVIVAGIFVLLEHKLAKRWSALRYTWPMCFLAAGFFLFLFSDTEIWPFGPQTMWYAITHNREDLQHKVFSLILLAVGYVEFEKIRGRLKGAWTAGFFPVMGMAGAILLLFHVHGGDMRAPDAMKIMGHIQHQHFWFACTGFGIALTSGLSEIHRKWRRIYEKAWPLLLVVLGFLLMLYTE